MSRTCTVTLIRGDGIRPGDQRRDGPDPDGRRRQARARRSTCGARRPRAGERSAATTHDRLDRADARRPEGAARDPEGEGFRSVNVALRQRFDLYANLRPSRTLAGVPSRYENVDIIMVREEYRGHLLGHRALRRAGSHGRGIDCGHHAPRLGAASGALGLRARCVARGARRSCSCTRRTSSSSRTGCFSTWVARWQKSSATSSSTIRSSTRAR